MLIPGIEKRLDLFQMRVAMYDTRSHSNSYVQKWHYAYTIVALLIKLPCSTRANVLLFQTQALDHRVLVLRIQTDLKSCSRLQRGMFTDTSDSNALDCEIQIFMFCHGDG